MRRHEGLLLVLGTVTGVALLVAGALSFGWGMLAGTASFGAGLFATQRRPRVRVLVTYLAVLAFYSSVRWLVPALDLRLQDDALLALDQSIFGDTPARLLAGSDALTDLLSVCYFSYHLYLHGALLHATCRPSHARHLLPPLMTAFAVGFVGYLLVPAVGPLVAFPELFSQPLGGGWLTTASRDAIAEGCAIYDVFPSLHLLMTLVLLDYDWHHHRRRFWWVLAPAGGLALSTLFLRYHYGIDLLAAVCIWAVIRWPVVHGGPSRGAGPQRA